MFHYAALEAARYRGGSHSGYAFYLLFRWLWHVIGWWSVLVWGALAGLGLWLQAKEPG
jgi:hypothetical protein